MSAPETSRGVEHTMREIKLSLTVEELNLVLEGLGKLPFASVYTLIGKLQEQTSAQLEMADIPGIETVPAPDRAGSGGA